MNLGDIHEYVGCLHIHTLFSDGTGPVDEIIGEAEETGLDFIGINDHRNLKVREMGYGGWHKSVFVLAGTELNDDVDKHNHLLAYGIDSLPDTMIPHLYVRAVREMGGLAIAAHPTEGRVPVSFRSDMTREYPWDDPHDNIFDAVEVWNYMSQWKQRLTLTKFSHFLRNPDDAVIAPDSETVSFWRKHGCSAIGGADAHRFRIGIGPISKKAYPYSMHFNRIRTHLLIQEELPSENRKAEKKLLEAIRSGNTFISNNLVGDARGFRISTGKNKLFVNLPMEGSIIIDSGQKREILDNLEPGNHVLDRTVSSGTVLEVWREKRLWIWWGVV